jgi:dipeptidyl aminopeptidase/acylaminoacyl peptidase
MFGPYDLLNFFEHQPEAWKPGLRSLLGDPGTPEGRAFFEERSPKTWMDQLACPLLVIQGRNDPRVVAHESEQLVADLQQKGKDVHVLVIEDEGHDVLKYANRVTCYNTITNFCLEYLNL